jgi:hypothetical protein
MCGTQGRQPAATEVPFFADPTDILVGMTAKRVLTLGCGLAALAFSGVAIALLYSSITLHPTPTTIERCGSVRQPGGAYSSEGGDCWAAVNSRRYAAGGSGVLAAIAAAVALTAGLYKADRTAL